MKACELSGKHLDYWIAMADGVVVTDPAEIQRLADAGATQPHIYWSELDGEMQRISGTEPLSKRYLNIWKSWAHCGPIIESNCIDTSTGFTDGSQWEAVIHFNDLVLRTNGPTLLVAAMRAYVASKFGEDLPAVPLLD